jgi:hypothetical protein
MYENACLEYLTLSAYAIIAQVYGYVSSVYHVCITALEPVWGDTESPPALVRDCSRLSTSS